jgi:hypothetical protein
MTCGDLLGDFLDEWFVGWRGRDTVVGTWTEFFVQIAYYAATFGR